MAYLLQENGVEQPSDMQGIVYTPMDEYDGWQTKLVKNMNLEEFVLNYFFMMLSI